MLGVGVAGVDDGVLLLLRFFLIDARYALITVVSTWSDDVSCAGLAEIRFGVNNIVNVEEEQPMVEWTISPNPATELITIQLPEVIDITRVSVYNSVGQLVNEIDVPNTNDLIVPIDEYRDGIYFISIATEEGILTKSFVKG